MNITAIEWTKRPGTMGMTWNPIRARRKANGKTGTFCTRISPGCKNCYASTINKRFGTGLPFEVPHLAEHEFYIDQRILEEPLKRKKPATIFVGDMFDLFHESIGDELILSVLNVIEVARWHTFQILTKRTGNMQEYMQLLDKGLRRKDTGGLAERWPHVWLGTSVESQKYADERIPLLLKTPAAVRFLSVEPLLEPVSLNGEVLQVVGWQGEKRYPFPKLEDEHRTKWLDQLDWVIVGGESGPGARPFNLRWAESLLDQCKRAGVPFFMKQIGSRPGYIRKDVWADYYSKGKGGDMQYWPEALRVREFPA